MVTISKVEFVEHIEENHSDVVDEEVLLSLKSDIRKSKKENGTTLQPFNPAPLLTPEPLYSSSYYPTYGQYTPPYYTSNSVSLKWA